MRRKINSPQEGRHGLAANNILTVPELFDSVAQNFSAKSNNPIA